MVGYTESMFDFTLVQILAVLLVIDSVGAIWVAWCGKRWFVRYFGMVARFFPPAKGWALLYFVLALIIALLTMNVL